MTRYKTIVSDPPWDYRRELGWNGREGTQHQTHPRYTLMTVSEICDLAPQVERWADDSCSLFLWATAAMLERSYGVVRAWGFPNVKAVVVWVKSENGQGTGQWTRNDTEFVLWATRGDVKPPAKAECNVIRSTPKGHSVKPQAFYDMVERISPGPYLDMFGGRGTLRFGWDAWGDGK